jgi:hypothetical protein
MQAERMILETDEMGHLEGLPQFPPHSKVELTFQVLEPPGTKIVRTPPRKLATMTRVCGDITDPALSPEDWEALR